jgi:hypothetical protein
MSMSIDIKPTDNTKPRENIDEPVKTWIEIILLNSQ